MRKRTVSTIAFGTLGAVGAVPLVIFVLALVGVVAIDSVPQEPAATEEASRRETEPAATTRPAARTQPPQRTTPAPTTTAPAPAPTTAPAPAPPWPPSQTTTAPAKPVQPSPAVVVITAARGDSWFSARVGSESGRVLDERVLAQGESVRLEGRRIWLSIGAAGNVDVTVDGKPRAIASGTVSLVLTGSPARNASS